MGYWRYETRIIAFGSAGSGSSVNFSQSVLLSLSPMRPADSPHLNIHKSANSGVILPSGQQQLYKCYNYPLEKSDEGVERAKPEKADDDKKAVWFNPLKGVLESS